MSNWDIWYCNTAVYIVYSTRALGTVLFEQYGNCLVSNKPSKGIDDSMRNKDLDKLTIQPHRRK